MGTCEMCGAENVPLRRASLDAVVVEVCSRCASRTGIQSLRPAPQKRAASSPKAGKSARLSGGYGGGGRRGKDIMLRGEKELVDDFAARIRTAREAKGLDQRGLARLMAEKVNLIQKAERGQRPTDNLIKKFERELGISLMEGRTGDAEQRVQQTGRRNMTLGDYYDNLKRSK